MKKEHVNLSNADLIFLEALQSKGSLKVSKLKRALALIELNKGKTYAEVSLQLGKSHRTITSWARKYKASGLSFLEDKPRPGRPIGISGEDRAKITAIACSEPPEGYARWSLRLLADRVVELEIVDSISFKHVGNILKKTNYNPIEKDNGASEK